MELMLRNKFYIFYEGVFAKFTEVCIMKKFCIGFKIFAPK